MGAPNHSDNPLPVPASPTLPLKTLQTTIQEGPPPQYSRTSLPFGLSAVPVAPLDWTYDLRLLPALFLIANSNSDH